MEATSRLAVDTTPASRKHQGRKGKIAGASTLTAQAGGWSRYWVFPSTRRREIVHAF